MTIDLDKNAYSDSITEISLVSPYTSKLLASMPQGRYQRSVAIFDDKILIVGGKSSTSTLTSVMMFRIGRILNFDDVNRLQKKLQVLVLGPSQGKTE